MDITAYNTERFEAVFDVSAWVPLFTLGTASWQLQARRAAASEDLYLDIPSVGSAVYAAGVITFLAPATAMRMLRGAYSWDMGFRPAGGDFRRIVGGTLTVLDGVTR